MREVYLRYSSRNTFRGFALTKVPVNDKKYQVPLQPATSHVTATRTTVNDLIPHLSETIWQVRKHLRLLLVQRQL